MDFFFLLEDTKYIQRRKCLVPSCDREDLGRPVTFWQSRTEMKCIKTVKNRPSQVLIVVLFTKLYLKKIQVNIFFNNIVLYIIFKSMTYTLSGYTFPLRCEE